MRRPMMAGNWKMNKTVAEAVPLAEAIRTAVHGYDRVDAVVCPPAIAVPAVAAALAGSTVAVGVQNLHWAESGAFTGEISAPMLQGLAEYVIIGHSERRQFFGETDETVHKKTGAALAHGLTPILCVGESLEQNRAGQTAALVRMQVEAALAGLNETQAQSLIIAYEPIWAIGTGLAATAEQAEEVCGGVVRAVVGELFGADVAAAIRILYGGSTNEKNIGEIMQQPNIDGALIGGASLKAESYSAMVRITHDLYAHSS
jgi:triosephosphate isomerase (TIM)